MSKPLDLRVQWLDKDRARVSWNDAYMLNTEGSSQAVVGLGGVVVLGGILGGIATGEFALLLLVLVGLGIVFSTLFTFTRPNALEISKTEVRHAGTVLDRGRISRVEYGRRSQWTGNAVAAHASDPMQIRIWIDDKSFHVISTNTWETQVVHRIKVQIDEVIAELNKTDVQIEREETQVKTGDFGMPDY